MSEPEPPPLPRAAESRYWFEENGQRAGPIDLAELTARIQDGRMARKGLVWKPPLTDWVAADSLPEIQAAFRDVPPPLPKRSRFEQLIVGVWEARPQTPGYEIAITARYTPDHRFNGTQSMRMLVAGFEVPPSTQPISGSWSASDLTDASFVLTVTPDQSQGFGGASIPIPSTTVAFHVIDQNTLQRTDDGSIVRRVG